MHSKLSPICVRLAKSEARCLSSRRLSFFHSAKNYNNLSMNTHSQNRNHFSFLKRLELSHSPKSPRTKFDYNNNYTAAVSLPVKTNDLDNCKDDVNKLLKLSKENILEHAARRVDLFFYTLVAYYKTQVIPEEG